MARKSLQLATFCLGLFGLLCWFVMFLAGTDVWHDVGSPNLWSLPGPPYHDVRAFVYAFYLLFIVLVAHLTVTALGFVSARKTRQEGA
jgi:hypothetical protein